MEASRIEFKYYRGQEADQFNFIKIPKCLITDPLFSDLTITSKLLYGLLLDRMSLSMKNGWVDEENRVFIIYQVVSIGEDLGVSRKCAIDTLKELEQFGLVEKKRRGLGMPSLLYIKSFIVERDCSHSTEEIESTLLAETSRGTEKVTSENEESDTSGSNEYVISRSTPSKLNRSNKYDTSRSNDIDTPRRAEKVTSGDAVSVTSGSSEYGLQDDTIPVPQNNTKKNNTKESNKSNPILSSTEQYSRPLTLVDSRDEMDEITLYRALIEDNIEYDALLERYPMDQKTIEGIADILLEVMLSKNDKMVVASNEYSTNFVKGKLMKLNMSHIEYVIDCLDKNTTKVSNIRQYVLAALFNAPSTINSFYRAAVNHDIFAGTN